MPENFGFAEISTIEDAHAAWESFFGRFFSPEIPPGVDVTFDPTLRVFAPRKNINAKYKHPGFRDPKTNQFPVDPTRTLHSDDFDDFLNGNKITIPAHITLDAEGLEGVAKAIACGDFEHPALNKEDHTFYALWLFKQNKITRQQMTTILARAQIPKEYPLEKTFSIFAHDGQLSKEAIELCFPAIVESIYGERLTREQTERLLNLILAAPKSEQVFFISKHNPQIIAPPNTRIQLGDALLRNRSWHRATYQGDEYDLYLSFGVIEALQIARYGVHGAAANRAKIGKLDIDAVKEGVVYNYRPTAISMPNSGVETPTKEIHGYADTPMPVVTEHDVYHAKIQSTLGPDFNLMLNHMHQIIAQHTKLKWSKTMWELIDREFLAFVHPTKEKKLKSGEERFIAMLHRDDEDQGRLFRSYDPPLLSDDGFAIVWHMVNHSDVWKKLYHVDVNRLGYPYDMLIKQIKAFQKTLDGIDKGKKREVASHHKHTEILTLKYRLFAGTSPGEFKKICRLIDALQDQLIPEQNKITDHVQKLIFGKYADRNNKNLTILKFKNFGEEILIDENSVKEIIPMLVNMQLISKFGEKNPEKVTIEVDQISKQFRSTYLNSTFSKKTLEASIQTFSTITEKLDFLEACYEQIIHSKAYTQRHATADKLFAFFKNPLTASQRKHIILLKEQLNELMTEYQESNRLSEEENEELQWYMRNRGSNLALCKTDRFYLHLDSTVPSAIQEMKP
ncbi:hypothetical protein OQJ13_12725 [Legionella sp. PATHC035]|uniref:hypothetical protein n=1 Tax=Legionella sp. PATHC035 TaxID=2992040 RepID=UPI002243A586|nr:hypothetical protein [Legionella sp. PATHC035]MCW8409835.1 hypothetical protein [Legionella sp. PATHC035]